MKTLLILTDFSANAGHSAAYGYNLAKQLKANVLLMNAMNIPAEIPQSGMVVCPMYEEEELIESGNIELRKLKLHLEANDYSETFRPQIDYVTESGKLVDVASHAATEDVSLIVGGNHERNGLSSFLMGNHCDSLINDAKKPLLIVPTNAKIKQIKKIAFATDFKHIGNDLESIYQLISFARPLNAEILLTHIYTEPYHDEALKPLIEQLMTELSNKADYANIYYRAVEESTVEKGLNWLCEHGQVDMLAMNHGPYSFINDVFNLGHTQKMAAQTSMPILVYQADK